MGERKTKVCMVIATLERGGAEKQLALLATRLDRSRFEPSVIALSRGGPFQEELEAAGVPCRVLGLRRWNAPIGLWRLRGCIRRQRPHVVHTWMFTANAYGRVAARLAGRPPVVVGERSVHAWKGRLRLAVDRALVRWTKVVVANSPSVARSLESVGVPGAIIKVIPNAFDPLGGTARDIDALGDFGDAPRLVTVGRLCPPKRHDVVLRATRRIIDAYPRATLTIAGEGPQRPALEALAAELGLRDAVRMPGTVSDVPALLAESDLFLFATDWEGLPNAVIEAMYAGAPVVATASPGVIDVVEDGATGLLTAGVEPEALAAGALELLGSAGRMKALAKRARGVVLERYSVERMVGAYQALYERLAAPQGGARA